MREERLVHPFQPVYDGNSRILILGSFPSAASREAMFYYGHRRNRFWKVLSALYGEEIPDCVEGKKAFLLDHGIALWDSIGACAITGSSDASIRDAVPNKISELLKKAPIERIFANGKASFACYEKYVFPETGIHAVPLPSTSPANAAWDLEKLKEAWRVIL
ncbi:MAG: DNA-deoxyinosine glycosylase [Clostridia bacterium]|nr:DNA-deoxyinosine glycosylase [Clostridia bacterium]